MDILKQIKKAQNSPKEETSQEKYIRHMNDIWKYGYSKYYTKEYLSNYQNQKIILELIQKCLKKSAIITNKKLSKNPLSKRYKILYKYLFEDNDSYYNLLLKYLKNPNKSLENKMKKNLNKGLCKNYKIKKRQILSVAILLTIFLSTPVYAQGTNNVNEVGIEINMGSGMTAEKLEYYKQKIQYSKLPKQLLNCGISLEKDEINKISSIIKEEFETNNYLLNTITTRNVIDKNGKETESVTKDNNKQSLKYKGKFTFLEDTREYKGDMSSTLLKSNIAIHYQIKGKVVVGMFYDEAGNYFMFVRYDANAAGVSASDQDMYNKLGTKSFESAIIVPLN